MRFAVGAAVYNNRDKTPAVVAHEPIEVLGELVYWLELPNGEYALCDEDEVEPLLVVRTEASSVEELQCR